MASFWPLELADMTLELDTTSDNLALCDFVISYLKSVIVLIVACPSQPTTTQKVIMTYVLSIHKLTLASRGATSGETLEIDRERI